MELKTKRLILRPIVMEDAQAVFDYSHQRSVGLNAGWKPHDTLEETRGMMQETLIGKEGVFAVILPETGQLIGSIGLAGDPRRENPNA